jgi:hypothetical protein
MGLRFSEFSGAVYTIRVSEIAYEAPAIAHHNPFPGKKVTVTESLNGLDRRDGRRGRR